MALYRLKSGIISRSRGQNIIACAAYRAGDRLYDERYGEIYDYTRKQDVAHSEIQLPQGAPVWMSDRQKLWNAVEAYEKRKDSQLAREIQLALPRELTLTQNIELVRDFVQDRFISCGMVADINIHIPKASDGLPQPHAHVLLTMRKVIENGFGLKAREWNERCELEMWRAEWCDYQNKHYALNGHDIRVDHRSLKEQGIDLIPQKKIGPTGFFTHMAAYEQHLENARTNGERLLANPEIVLEVLAHQQSTFNHQDIARIVNRYTADGDQFLAVYEKVKVLPSLVTLGIDSKNQERFTTKDMVQLESEMMANAQSLNARLRHAVQANLISSTSDKQQLSKEQAMVLNHIVSMGDLKNVVGFAGTGKSRLLGAAREVWEASGYQVIGATLSGIAAENLEGSSGIASRTLASRLYSWEKGREELTSNDIFVIDEAGMLGTRQLAQVMDEANRHGAKVVLVGDPEQLQAIEAGAAFRGVIKNNGHIELTEIWRQQVAWQREATVQFATQKTADAIAQYAANDCVHAFETKADAMHALVSGWNDTRISQPDKTQIIIAYTRAEVLALNQSARRFCQETGDLTNEREVATERGERLFAEGERIYFLKNDRDLGVKNGTLGTILKMEDQLFTVKLDKDDKDKTHTICFSTNRYNHLDYGYAATVYKSQGVTVDRSSILASRYMDSHSAYVEMTRHREGAEIYWSKDEFKDDEQMIKMLSRERDKDLVQDYIGLEYEKASFAMYRGLDTLWETFWQKYGKEWLEKIQHTISVWVDGAKELVETIKEQTAKTLCIFDKDEESWLKDTRAWLDATFGKDESMPDKGQSNENVDQKHITSKEMNPVSSIEKEVSLTDEERYQRIVKDGEMWDARLEANRLLKQYEQSHLSTEKNEKSIEKTLDKEIDF